MKNEERELWNKALKSAVEAIYYDDESDYGGALWEIVGYLGGDKATELLEEDPETAYEKYCEANKK